MVYIPPAYQILHHYPNSKRLVYKARDSKGRIQYIYHPQYIEQRQKIKYCDLQRVARHYKALQKQIHNDLQLPSKDQHRTLCAIAISLIFDCGLRIGNISYENLYQTYGISTLRWSHLSPSSMIISFPGKKSRRNVCVLESSAPMFPAWQQWARRRSRHNNTKNDYIFLLPSGKHVTSKDINAYLSEFDTITTKMLRTYSANLYLIDILSGIKFTTLIERKQQLMQALSVVAQRLHHTPTVCRKNYIFPPLWNFALQYTIPKSSTSHDFFASFLESHCDQ